MIIENETCALFEFDDEKVSTRMPDKLNVKLPKVAIMCFFKEVVKEYSKLDEVNNVMTVYHDIIDWNYYEMNRDKHKVVFTQAPMGAPLCVNIMEDLYANGVELIIACGGCGVLSDIQEGEILIPTSAIRDEGTSFHYIKPSKVIKLDSNVIKKVENILQDLEIKYETCKTWTTDASKRETPEKIELRKKQGCKTVEMECSALTACASFRDKQFVELLYSGDLLNDVNNYNSRNWQFNNTAREKLFNICLELGFRLDEQI